MPTRSVTKIRRSRKPKQNRMPLAGEDPAQQTLSPNQAARLLNVTGECVKQWICGGKLPATKASNGYYRIRYADTEAYLKSRYDLTSKSVQILCDDKKTSSLLRAAIEKAGINRLWWARKL